MMESDTDRLEMIRAVGGISILAPEGEFFAIFENEFLETESVETKVPVLTCRSSDVEGVQLRKDSQVTIALEIYRVRRIEADGTGMSRVLLKR